MFLERPTWEELVEKRVVLFSRKLIENPITAVFNRWISFLLFLFTYIDTPFVVTATWTHVNKLLINPKLQRYKELKDFKDECKIRGEFEKHWETSHCLSLSQSVCLSVSFYVFVSLSVPLFVSLSESLSFYLCVCLSVHVFVNFPISSMMNQKFADN